MDKLLKQIFLEGLLEILINLSEWLAIIPGILPFEAFEMSFMQRALVGLMLLAPMTAAMGVQVVNMRMAFFADAISHSAFAGIAVGVLMGISPDWSMPVFAVVVGLVIAGLNEKGSLSTDTAIGVVFSGVIAFGIAIISRNPGLSSDIGHLVYGDVLTLQDGDIVMIAFLAIALAIFQIFAYNRLLYIGINPLLAKTHRIPTRMLSYIFAGFLALVVMLALRATGIFLVTAMLVVPAAAARNIAKSAAGMFWWAQLIAITSAFTGLIISAQDWAGTATGATVILIAFIWFILSSFVGRMRRTD